MTKARDLANAGTALTTVSATELGYLDGVTSAVQTQLNAKAATTNASISWPIFTAPEEVVYSTATSANGTINFDKYLAGVQHYTLNATGDWTLNVRRSPSATLDSDLSVGQSVTISFLVTNGATAYKHTALTIDGSAQTVKWSGGTAPSAGNASAIDAYSFTIIKTASATYTVLGAGPIKYA